MKTQMTNNDLPKILIIGTLPYDPNESSRALDTYFHNWPKEKLRMVFSNSKNPSKGHCSSFYQITDVDVFKNFFLKKKTVGRIFFEENLKGKKEEKTPSKLSKVANIFKKKTFFRFYLRKLLWGKKRWLSDSLSEWVSEFKPEILYLCLSDDYFILDIAYYFSQKLNIPLIVQIGDDYFFKKHPPLLYFYNTHYKKLFIDIMNTKGFGVYISDKLADKYNSYFRKQGFPIYLSSTIESIETTFKFEFNYFGKTDLGRYKSLALLGDALYKINPVYKINVYSNFSNGKIINFLTNHNCCCHNAVTYEKVIQIMNSGAINIVASGFDKADIESTRYSLSTKIADSLVSSGPIIAIGPKGDGAIDYLRDKNCAIVLDNKIIDVEQLKTFLGDKDLLRSISSNAKEVYNRFHNLEKNRKRFENECLKIGM